MVKTGIVQGDVYNVIASSATVLGRTVSDVVSFICYNDLEHVAEQTKAVWRGAKPSTGLQPSVENLVTGCMSS